MDFMHDSLADGTTFRGMTLIDLYSRECLAAVACRSFSGADVASVLAVVGIDRGALPK
jgi:putative transposase